MVLQNVIRRRSLQEGGTRLPVQRSPSALPSLRIGDRAASGGTPGLVARIVLPVAILAGSWMLTEALVSSQPEVARSPRSEAIYPVEAATVVRADHRPTIDLFGEIVPARVAELRAISAGEVVELHSNLNVGGHVASGDVLVRVDDFPYRGAVTEAEANLTEAAAGIAEAEARIRLERANLAAAEEQLAIAQRDLERAAQLAKSGNITEQSIDARRLLVSQREQAADQIRNTISVAEAQLAQQRAAVERLEWQRDRAVRGLRDTVLRAPFDGVVIAETAETGRMLNANDIVVSLYQPDTLDVRFAISDLQFGRLLASGHPVEGTGVEVTWRIGDRPLTYPAVIQRIGAEIASARGGVDVFARLRLDPDGVVPRPGAFVEIEVPALIHANSIRIAASALFDDHVFVIDDGKLRRRRVELLAMDGADVIVDGELQDGDRVMTTRLGEAGEGVRVTDTAAGEPDGDAIAEAKRGKRS